MDQSRLPNMPAPEQPGPNQPAPEGPPILTKDDLKHIQDQDIYLQTRDPQVHAGQKATIMEAVREVLAEMGVLTTANFGAFFTQSPEVYQRLSDTVWEQATKVEAHESPAVGQAEIAGN